jgi:hypothetical protein
MLNKTSSPMPTTAKISCFLKLVKAPVRACEAEAMLKSPMARSRIIAPIKTQSSFLRVVNKN